jgi:hypothetical protein
MATIVRPAQPPTPRTADAAEQDFRDLPDPGPLAKCGCPILALEVSQGECTHNNWLKPTLWDAATVRSSR